MRDGTRDAMEATIDQLRTAAVYFRDRCRQLLAERDAAVARAEKAEALLHRLADGDSEALAVLQQWRRPVTERNEPYEGYATTSGEQGDAPEWTL